MIRRVSNLIFGRTIGMHQAAYILAAFTAASSVIAILRDRMLAYSFGAGVELDLYYAAFRIPDLIFISVASLFSAYVLIPELTARREDTRQKYVDNIVGVFSVLMLSIGILAFIATPYIIPRIFPALAVDANTGEMLILLTRIILLQPILLGLSNIFGAIAQLNRKYFVYAFAPILYNIGIMFGIVVLLPVFGLPGIAFGVVLGALAHLALQGISGMRDGYLRIPKINELSDVLRTVKISIPRTAALSASGVALLGLTVMAGMLAPGSIAVFTLSFNALWVFISVIGMSYSVAAFPVFAKLFTDGAKDEFLEKVASVIRSIIFWAFPATALLIILRAHIVRVILGTGAFDWTDTRLTAAALAVFAISIIAHSFISVFSRAYYAASRSYIPLFVNIFGAGVALSLGVIFVYWAPGLGGRMFLESLLRVVDVPGSEMLMLPLAYTVGASVSALAYIFLFGKHFGVFAFRLTRVFWEASAAAGMAGASAYGILAFLGGINELTTFTLVLTHGGVAGVTGLGVAGLTYYLLGSVEIREILSALRRRSAPLPPMGTEDTSL